MKKLIFFCFISISLFSQAFQDNYENTGSFNIGSKVYSYSKLPNFVEISSNQYVDYIGLINPTSLPNQPDTIKIFISDDDVNNKKIFSISTISELNGRIPNDEVNNFPNLARNLIETANTQFIQMIDSSQFESAISKLKEITGIGIKSISEIKIIDSDKEYISVLSEMEIENAHNENVFHNSAASMILIDGNIIGISFINISKDKQYSDWNVELIKEYTPIFVGLNN